VIASRFPRGHAGLVPGFISSVEVNRIAGRHKPGSGELIVKNLLRPYFAPRST